MKEPDNALVACNKPCCMHCANYREWGHKAVDCPNQKPPAANFKKKKSGIKCWGCGKIGHKQADCNQTHQHNKAAFATQGGIGELVFAALEAAGPPVIEVKTGYKIMDGETSDRMMEDVIVMNNKIVSSRMDDEDSCSISSYDSIESGEGHDSIMSGLGQDSMDSSSFHDLN